jgi:hypothetical protein
MEKVHIKTYNGGHFEYPAKRYILSKIFPEFYVKNRNEVHNKPSPKDIIVHLFLSFAQKNFESHGFKNYLYKTNETGKVAVFELDERFEKDILLFFSGESWDVECVPFNSDNNVIVFSPFRENREKGVFQMYWITIAFVQFYLRNYIYKYQNNKIECIKQKEHLFVYCNSNKTKERTQFMTKLVQMYTTHNKQSEIYCIGGHKIEGASTKKIQRFSSPSCVLVDEYSKYKFAVVFENREKTGYITEKLLQAFIANAIPIYWGDHENAKTFFNPEAFICVRDFESYEACIDYIYKMSDTDITNMLMQPMFKDNKIPEQFDIENFDTGYYGEIKKYVRDLYFK